MNNSCTVDLQNFVGKGYNRFWHCTKRYRIVKGSRGSKKSCTASLWYVVKMMEFYHLHNLKPNVLVIRRYYNTHKNSTRAQLVWAIERLNVRHLWRIPKGDNELTYLPSGQKILFRGLDDPQSIASITVENGFLCWVWFEEAFQITSEDSFNKIDMSIRGDVPSPLFKQFTLTFNPWSDRSWLRKRFFNDSYDREFENETTFSISTTYETNEFLGLDDLKIFEIMKENNPRRYRIEGLAEWGISEGLIYENWRIEDFNVEELLLKHRNDKTVRGLPSFVSCNGMDFGYNDPTVMIGAYADRKNYKIYVWYEFHEVMMENRKIAGRLINDGFGESTIIADSEDPRTINELRLLGLRGIRGAKKGNGSVLGGIQKLQDYEIIVSPKCPRMIESLSNYSWKKDRATDKVMNEPDHEFSHAPDALRYGCEELQKFGVRV